jgi:glucosamine kinase
MKIIVDSGSTKANWYLADPVPGTPAHCQTSGINPFYQSSSEIVKTLEAEFSLDKSAVTSVVYYGAGVANELKRQELMVALQSFFHATEIRVESDLLAAAHALCGHQEGIAAILGTGSNSCYYDGKTIVQNVSPLGFILGDEGSGAVLGKKLLSDVLKNQMPQNIIRLFHETYNLSAGEILESVYRKPYPNRFLAGFTRFLSAHIQEEAIYNLVYNSFIEFFIRNIKQYPHYGNLQVHCTGSIAFHFSEVLKDAASTTGHTIGKIVQDPMEGLLEYHRNIS